jgi:hypothetical protein
MISEQSREAIAKAHEVIEDETGGHLDYDFSGVLLESAVSVRHETIPYKGVRSLDLYDSNGYRMFSITMSDEGLTAVVRQDGYNLRVKDEV